MLFSDLLQLISVTVVISAVIYGVIQGVHYIVNRRQKDKEEYLKSFDTVVSQLSSDNKSSQLAAAILLRRYFAESQNKRDASLHTEAINVISALLRTLPTGIFQKVLGDGLAYADDLSGADLQRTNLQDVYLGRKTGAIKVDYKTDFYRADLSYALIENVVGDGVVFSRTVLFNARIKNCTLTNANFSGADLTNVFFKNVKLFGADFSGAKNVPEKIAVTLDAEGRCTSDELLSLDPVDGGKKIFFSMPGTMTKADELVTTAYRDYLEKNGFDVLYYKKDNYPEFGQFTRIKESVMESSAMIVFGFKQVKIGHGKYYPGTAIEHEVNEKYLPTPWNELETGMALARNLPILLVKDPSIETGIFDEKLSECFVMTVSSELDTMNLDSNKELKTWIDMFK